MRVHKLHEGAGTDDVPLLYYIQVFIVSSEPVVLSNSIRTVVTPLGRSTQQTQTSSRARASAIRHRVSNVRLSEV